jgi:hypothetical protein
MHGLSKKCDCKRTYISRFKGTEKQKNKTVSDDYYLQCHKMNILKYVERPLQSYRRGFMLFEEKWNIKTAVMIYVWRNQVWIMQNISKILREIFYFMS